MAIKSPGWFGYLFVLIHMVLGSQWAEKRSLTEFYFFFLFGKNPKKQGNHSETDPPPSAAVKLTSIPVGVQIAPTGVQFVFE